MTDEAIGTSVEIMGKIYQIKCPKTEVNALQRAAQYLEEKMRVVRDSGALCIDRVAVIAALNVVHQLLSLEQQKNQHVQVLNQRLDDLQNKIDNALAQTVQMELYSTE